MIPKDLTCDEVGIYLELIGRAMQCDDICAQAVIDEALEDEDVDAFGFLRVGMSYEYGITDDRIKELIAMDLEEAINFNPSDKD